MPLRSKRVASSEPSALCAAAAMRGSGEARATASLAAPIASSRSAGRAVAGEALGQQPRALGEVGGVQRAQAAVDQVAQPR